MTLEEAREAFRNYGGKLKGWALARTTLLKITDELGVELTTFHGDVKLFGVPVVFVDPGGPEGVIM